MTDSPSPPYERRGRSPHRRNTGPMLAVPRCGAKTRAGTPCKSPQVSGRKRCRMHGGAHGSGGQPGNRNALKHGWYSARARLWRRSVQRALREMRETLAIFRAAPVIGEAEALRLALAMDHDPELALPWDQDWRAVLAEMGGVEGTFGRGGGDVLPCMAPMDAFCREGEEYGADLRCGLAPDDRHPGRRRAGEAETPGPMPENGAEDRDRERAEREKRRAEAEAILRAMGAIPPFVAGGAEAVPEALTLPSRCDGPRPLPQAGEGKLGDIPLTQTVEGAPSDRDRAPSPAGARGAPPAHAGTGGHPRWPPGGRGTGVRATSADSPLPVSTALQELDDWRLRPGEVPGKVWDSRIHGFGAAERGGGAVIEGGVPGFDDDD